MGGQEWDVQAGITWPSNVLRGAFRVLAGTLQPLPQLQGNANPQTRVACQAVPRCLLGPVLPHTGPALWSTPYMADDSAWAIAPIHREQMVQVREISLGRWQPLENICAPKRTGNPPPNETFF